MHRPTAVFSLTSLKPNKDAASSPKWDYSRALTKYPPIKRYQITSDQATFAYLLAPKKWNKNSHHSFASDKEAPFLPLKMPDLPSPSKVLRLLFLWSRSRIQERRKMTATALNCKKIKI
jgi:hypothetical protein